MACVNKIANLEASHLLINILFSLTELNVYNLFLWIFIITLAFVPFDKIVYMHYLILF